MIFLPVQRDVHISYKLFICNISTNAVAALSLINGVSCLHKLYVDISELFNNTEVDSNRGYRLSEKKMFLLIYIDIFLSKTSCGAEYATCICMAE